MDSILPICDTCRKNERYYCYLFCYEKKCLSVIWDSFSFSRHLYFKNMCQTGEFWDLKFRAQRWIWFSQYVTHVGKMRDVIILCFVMRKKLSYLFDIHFDFLDICISKKRVKQGNSKIWNLGLRDGFDFPNLWHL